MNKAHDFFATSLYQPDLTTDDLYNLGLTPENTGMKSKEEYKKIPKVIDYFTENGVFNEETFNDVYDNTLLAYNDYANKEFQKKVLSEFQYDPTDWRAPLGRKTWDTAAKIQLGEKNPTMLSVGVERIGLTSESKFSVRELAQMNEARSMSGESLGWTPNEKGGLFKALDRPSLALAIYTENGTHEIDGRTYEHKAGDYKLDEYGMPYYEEVGDQDTSGREMLHYTDTFTVDGEKWNKYDFFDSDGLEKSIGGIAAKTAVTLIPYMIPYVREFWGAVNVSKELSKLLPVLGKAFNGIFNGDPESDLIKDLNKLENYVSRFDASTSDEGMKQYFGLETVGNLLSSVGSQLFQQRVISMIPTILGDPAKAGVNAKLGQELALAYMAGTSSTETYSSFIEAGANPRVAGLATIANMLALNGLMRIDYFKSTLFKGSYLDDDVIREPAKKVAQKVMSDTSKEGAQALAQNASKEANKNLLKKMVGYFTDDLEPALMKSEFVKHSVAEGVEEVMEEMVFDINKGLNQALSSLGVPMYQNNELAFDWDIKEMGLRYLTSFVGGTLGGAMFQANNKWEKLLFGNATSKMDEDELSQLTYLIAEGRGNDIKKYYKKLHDKGLLGNTSLSGSKFETVTDIKGNDVVVEADGARTQNDVTYDVLCRHVDYIESLLSSEGMKIPEKVQEEIMTKGIRSSEKFQVRTLKAQILNESLVRSGFFNEFNRLGNQIIKKRAELDTALGITSDAEERNDAPKEKNLKAEKILEELKALRKQRDEILNGERSAYYITQGLFVLDEATNKNFVDISLEKYTQAILHKKYSDLNDDQKKEIKEEYEEYMNREGKINLYRAYDVYQKLSARYKDRIMQEAKEAKGYVDDTLHKDELNGFEYLKSLIEHNTLQSELAALKMQDELSEEDEKKVLELEGKIAGVTAKLGYFINNPSVLLQNPAEDGINLQVHMGEMSNEDSRKIAQDYILNLYKQYQTGNIRVRSEDELDTFYALAKKLNSHKDSDKKFSEYLRNWYEEQLRNNAQYRNDDYDLLASVNNDPYNGIFASDYLWTPAQTEFMNAVKEIESNLTSKNGSKALEAFENAINILLNHTKLSRDEASNLVKSLLPNVSSEYIIDFVQKIEDYRKQIKFSSIPDLLADLYSDITGDKNNIIQLITSEENRLSAATKTTDYLISSGVKPELEDIQKMLRVMRGLITGSVNGLNQAANVLRKDGAIFAELDDATAKMLYKDIAIYEDRIEILLKLHESNRVQKLRMQKEIMCKVKPKFIQYIIEPGFAKTFKEQFGFDPEEVFRTINNNRINLSEVNDNNFSTYEQVAIEFEDEMYERLKNLSVDDLTTKITSCFGSDIYKMISTPITSETTTINSVDIAFYLANLYIIKGSTFYGRLKEENERSKFAPILGQEFAIKNNICNLLNPEVYNSLLEKIGQKYTGTYAYIKAKPVLKNANFSIGGAGVGKTTAIASNSIRMAGDNVEYVLMAPTDSQVKKLKSDLDLDVDAYTDLEFFTKAVKDWKEDKVLRTNKYETVIQDLVYNNVQFFKTTNSKKVFIVDEATLYDSGKWKIISEIAQREGAVIWGLGDTKQNSAEVKVENQNIRINSSIEDFWYAKSPLLSTSMRSNFAGKLDNFVLLDTLLTISESKVAEMEQQTISEYNAEIEKLLLAGNQGSRFSLQYWEDPEVGVVGEKFIDEADAATYVSKLSKLGTVLYITDKDVPSIPGVEKRDSLSAQGGEFDFVVIDKKWTHSGSKYNAVRDLYTLTQRSRRGSVIVDRGMKNLLGLDNISRVTAKQNIAINTGDIDEFKKWRFDGLNVGSYDDLDSFLVRSQQTPPPPPPPPPAGQPAVVPGTNPTTPPPATAPSTPPSTPPAATGTPPAAASGQQVPPQVPPVAGQTAQRQNSPKAKKPKVYERTGAAPTYGGKIVTMSEDDFYSWINSPHFVIHQKGIEKSLNQIIPLENNTEKDLEAYKTIVAWIAGIIKLNKYEGGNRKVLDKNEVRDLFSNPTLSHIGVDRLNQLRTILENDVEVWFDQFNGRTMVNAKFVSLHGETELEIPVGMMNIVRYGKYNGEFRVKEHVRFEKSDPKRISLTPKDVEQKYPGLKILPYFGVLSVANSTLYQNNPDFEQSTKDFIDRNNGKVMAAITDNPIIANFYQKYNVFNFGTYQKKEGEEVVTYKYLIDDKQNIGLAGIHRSLPVSDIIRFAILRDARYHNKQLSDYDLDVLDITDPIQTETKLSGTTEPLPGWPQNTNGIGDFWKQLDNRKHQIMPYEYVRHLFAEIINNSAGDSDYAKMCRYIIKECLIEKPVKKKNGDIQKYGLKITVGNKTYFVTNTLNVDGTNADINVTYSIAQLTDEGLVFLKDNTGNYIYFNKMSQLYNILGVSDNNPVQYAAVSELVRSSNNYNVYELTPNKQLYEAFSWVLGKQKGVLHHIDSLFKSSKFKYGLYAQDNGGQYLSPDTYFRRLNGEISEYVLDIEDWSYSAYTLDLSQLQEGTKTTIDGKENKRITYETQIDELKVLLKGKFKFANILEAVNQTDLSEEEKWKKLISDINETLKLRGVDNNYAAIETDPTGKLVLTNKTLTAEEFINKLLAGENLELDEVKYNFINNFKCAIFSVTLGDIYCVYKSKDGWVLAPFKSYESFVDVYEFAKQIDKKMLQQQCPNFENFLESTLTDSNEDNHANEVTTQLHASLDKPMQDLKQKLITYLENRLKNNEC